MTSSGSNENGLNQVDYKLMIDSLPVCLIRKDLRGWPIFANKRYLEFYGITLAQLIRNGEPIDDERQLAESMREDRETLENGTVFQRIVQHVQDDGTECYLEYLKGPQHDAAGNIAGLQVLSWVATDRIEAEEELAHERGRLQTLMNHLPDVIFIKDRAGRFRLTNPALNHFYGCTSSNELVGKTDFDFIPDAIARKFAEDDQRVMNSGEPLIDREECNIGPDGAVHWMLTSKIPLQDAQSEVVGIVGIGRDVTRLKIAQDAATRKAMEVDLLYQATSLARDTDSLDDALSGCLKIVCDLTDWDAGHVLWPAKTTDENGNGNGRELESTGIWHPPNSPELTTFREHSESSTIQKGKSLSGRVWDRREPLWVSNLQHDIDPHSGRIFEEAGIFSGVAFPIIIQDETVAILEFFAFTEQPEDPELLSAFQSVGEQVGRVIKRNRYEENLRLAREAADAANRAKGDFLANVSHEIRTPMNGVIGMTELLMETQLTPTQFEYLTMVQTSGETLLDLINDILDFSKIESGKMELEKIAFNLYDSLGDTMKLLGTRAHKQDLELAFSIHPDVPEYLIGDPARLRQVIINLVGNAIKFTQEGEVVLRVTRREYTETAVQLRLTVFDTGIGIPSDKIEDIFNAFQQADTSTTRSFGGTGLGLAISTRLVGLMGGKLTCKSVEGQGSEFSFDADFGIAVDFQHLQSLRDPIAVQSTRTLIVDDNKTNRVILTEMCSNWGMDPVAASGVNDAWQILNDNHEMTPFLLILSDVNMPEADGFELCERLRSDPRFVNVKVIMLTSAGRQGDSERRDELQVAANLLKPVKQSELFDTIVNVLGVNHTETGESDRSGNSQSSARGLRVLLAEDNLVNQKLAIGLLKKMGHTVTLAENGSEATKAYRENHKEFDVVLMDVQMPIMDGFGATAAIREFEDKVGTKTPIIAMTAHAMTGDRERCLEAGMDEYLSKPIRGTQIAEMFVRLKLHAPQSDNRQQLEASTETDPPQVAASTTTLVDWNLALESVAGDRSLLKAVIDAFLEEAPMLLNQAKSSFEDGDTKTLHRMGHSLKGALSTLGAVSVSEIAGELQQIGAAGTTKGAAEVIAKLSPQLDLVIAEYSDFQP